MKNIHVEHKVCKHAINIRNGISGYHLILEAKGAHIWPIKHTLNQEYEHTENKDASRKERYLEKVVPDIL